MVLKSFYLDRKAHDLVLKYRDKKDRNNKSVIKESHKMRVTVSYGLERFWGEQIRLQGSEEGNYWKETWNKLAEILQKSGIQLPNDSVDRNSTQQIQQMADKLWKFDPQQSKIALAVLTQLCDCMVWWTQRYK